MPEFKNPASGTTFHATDDEIVKAEKIYEACHPKTPYLPFELWTAQSQAHFLMLARTSTET